MVSQSTQKINNNGRYVDISYKGDMNVYFDEETYLNKENSSSLKFYKY